MTDTPRSDRESEQASAPAAPHKTPTRRQFLHGAGVLGAAGAVAAGTSACAGETATNPASGEKNSDDSTWPGQGMQESGEAGAAFLADSRVEFDGEHQAGISTPEQAFIKLIAFDLKSNRESRDDATRLMRLWTDDARRMCSGLAGLADLEKENLTSTANLTITVGFGRSFLDKLGLGAKAPAWLGDLPEYSRDELSDAWSGGDLCLQICGDDRFTVSHAARFMTKAARSYADVTWIQDGFLHARGSVAHGETPRNLFGQLDGTGNPPVEEFNDLVWISDGPEWLRGGTAMVVRRVAMLLDEWDILDRPSREVVTGRTLDNGAPLTGENEYDEPDLEARDEYGLPVIDPNSHMARAKSAPDNQGERIFRRPFNYDMPPGPDSRGSSNAGQIFICFQQDPLRQFDPIQKRLDEADRLNEWIVHIGSAVFAIPHGTVDGEYWGQDLLEG